MSENLPTLLPCPFCGAVAEYAHNDFYNNNTMARCTSCRAEAFYRKWNKRDNQELERLQAIINTPQADDFLRAVSIEAEHQRQRWGSDHDSGKEPSDWFWLIGYLAGKALHSQVVGDRNKAEHHIITTAAACENWHRSLLGKTDMRPGLENHDTSSDKEISTVPNSR